LLELLEDKVILPPLTVKLPDSVCVVPMVTLPKLMEPGVTPNVPLDVVPLPVRDTDRRIGCIGAERECGIDRPGR
jgi:hypothetical protein